MSINPNQLFLDDAHSPFPPNASASQMPELNALDQEAIRRRFIKEEDLKAKERALANLLIALSDTTELEPGGQGDIMQEDGKPKAGAYRPVIPDEVAQYYLEKVGFETSDVRVTRLLALAAQKFAADIASDSYHYARTRTLAAAGAGRGRPAANPEAHAAKEAAMAAGVGKTRVDKSRTVLTMEDLAAALQEYGINASRAPYYL